MAAAGRFNVSERLVCLNNVSLYMLLQLLHLLTPTLTRY